MKGTRAWWFVDGEGMMIIILWKSLENVGRSGTQRSQVMPERKDRSRGKVLAEVEDHPWTWNFV